MKRVAVIGGGVSGLATARALAADAEVTLFEQDDRLGGHAHTVPLTLDGVSHGVDTGFLVFNHRTYPKLVRLFDELGVETAPAEMSFSVQVPQQGLEWSGSSLDTVFAQRANLLRPRFYGMLVDILRFNRLASALAVSSGGPDTLEPVADFLQRHRFGRAFVDDYLLPMVACIWSCPTAQMLRFPIASLVRFCHNHGLLQVSDRPQWFTVRGGSRHYVERMLPRTVRRCLATPARRVERLGMGVSVCTDQGRMRFDEVVLACHSDQALGLLTDADADERALLGAIRYQANEVLLHTDERLLPRRRKAWAAWNYERASSAADERSQVCLHYLINRLQPLPWSRPVVVSMNPVRAPAPDSVFGRWEVQHPVFDAAAIAAQRQLPGLQGRRSTWFAGAWTGYGFHEDGLASALDVAAALRQSWRTTAPRQPALAA